MLGSINPCHKIIHSLIAGSLVGCNAPRLRSIKTLPSTGLTTRRVRFTNWCGTNTVIGTSRLRKCRGGTATKRDSARHAAPWYMYLRQYCDLRIRSSHSSPKNFGKQWRRLPENPARPSCWLLTLGRKPKKLTKRQNGTCGC